MRKVAFICVLLTALALNSIGCAIDATDSVDSRAQSLTTTFDNVTVEAHSYSDGSIETVAKNANHELLVRFSVRGDVVKIESAASHGPPKIMVVPHDDRNTLNLESWSYYSYAYSQNVPSIPPVQGELATQQKITGRDCIAAGSTWYHCWYYIAFLA